MTKLKWSHIFVQLTPGPGCSGRHGSSPGCPLWLRGGSSVASLGWRPGRGGDELWSSSCSLCCSQRRSDLFKTSRSAGATVRLTRTALWHCTTTFVLLGPEQKSAHLFLCIFFFNLYLICFSLLQSSNIFQSTERAWKKSWFITKKPKWFLFIDSYGGLIKIKNCVYK